MADTSLDRLVEVIQSGNQTAWADRNKEAFQTLFGTPDGRYKKTAEKTWAVRAPEMSTDSGVPFAAYIHADNPRSGPYSGMSLALFPVPGEPCLLSLIVGTQGLAPDEAILGKPGHARKAQAICAWLNRDFGNGEQIAWAKQDPTRTDIWVPDDLRLKWSAYKDVFDRYGKEMYALFLPTPQARGTKEAITAFLDLLMAERGFEPNANCKDGADRIQSQWFGHLMPRVEATDIERVLANRRFVIIQGPPGTGKTRMATELLKHQYRGVGRSIQFHPNTTYESFIGGLAPVHSADELGLAFKPKPGFLMEAAAEATLKPSTPYLLHIDEINRADLSKVLGEAIFLLEPQAEPRTIALPYDFGPPFGRNLSLPPNLHILGTMNSADRSIAIVDVAVRRRFGYLSLWPEMDVVTHKACPLMQDAFKRIVRIFIEHATDDAFNLVPGHAYFLEQEDTKARENLKINLAPLLEEYLTQGYVGGFAEPIRSFLQWLRSL